MKKQSTFSQLAFFNLRASIGLCGVSLGLLGLGAFSAKAQQNYDVITRSTDPLVPPFFDCSKIHELGIDRQQNFRAGAIMIACGLSEGGIPFHGSGVSRFVQKLMAPVSYGGLDVDLITGPETFPNVTQSWSRINCCTVKCIRPARIDDFLPKQPHATAFDINS
jgi:hypothetical protein